MLIFMFVAVSAVVKSLVMMAGEIEYEDFIYENGTALYPMTGHLMILLFVVLISIPVLGAQKLHRSAIISHAVDTVTRVVPLLSLRWFHYCLVRGFAIVSYSVPLLCLRHFRYCLWRGFAIVSQAIPLLCPGRLRYWL